MIYTLTFNPSLDYRMEVKKFSAGELNRSQTESVSVGGKGIMVSLVLNHLGQKSTALGFVAGFVGDEIIRGLNKAGIETDFIKLDSGNSRINVKVFSQEETEINAVGPVLTEEKFNILCEKINEINEDDVLIISGKILPGLDMDCYEEILKKCKCKNIAIDVSEKAVLSLLKFKPFLIKPNHHELGDLFGVKINSNEEVIFYAEKLIEKGAKNVLVSMAEKGAILVTENENFYVPARKGIVKNSVGAGDSSVAGFVYKYLETGSEKSAAEFAVEIGSRSAFGEIDLIEMTKI